MIVREEIQKILSTALDKGADFADIYIERRTSTTMAAENKKIEMVNGGITLGAGIRVVAGESIGFSSIDSIDEKTLIEATRAAAAVAAAGVVAKAKKRSLPELKDISVLEEVRKNTQVSAKASKIHEASQAAWSMDKRIRQVTVGYGDLQKDFWVANTEGTWVSDSTNATRMTVAVVASEGSVVQTGYEGPGELRGFEFFNENNPEIIARMAASRALTMLEAEPAPTGEMPVVLEEGYGGVLLHEACGHGLEADLVLKGASIFADMIGKKVASELVTAVDDPTIPGWWGSYRYDDEGTACQRNVLIENGILIKYLQSKETARRTQAALTGNGRRQSYRHLPIPRMSNTFIAPGNTPIEEMIGSITKGLYAKALGGGQVNTINGDFVFGVAEGFLIENGKITRPVRGATLIGNGMKALMDIEAVGTNLDAKPGFCGKDGQSVPVTTGQPAIMIKRLTVGGTAL